VVLKETLGLEVRVRVDVPMNRMSARNPAFDSSITVPVTVAS
jgi:hypothetical protein